MFRQHRVGVVLPAYNEAGFVGAVIDRIPAYVDRVYVVDDASTDGTWEEVLEHATRVNDGNGATSGRRDGRVVDGRDGPTIVTIRHARNRGAGGAIKTGYRHAIDDDLDIVATVDSDGQQDPRDIDRLLDPIVDGRADYAKGNRLLEGGRGEMPKHRFVGNVLLGILTKIASGYWEISDPQTGFTAISRRALDAIDVDGLYEYYGYPNDLLVKLNVAGMRVVDVPVPNHYGDEESHIRYRSYVPRVSWLLFRDFLWRLRTKYIVIGFHPLVIVYAVGSLSVLAGVAGGITMLAAGGLTPGFDGSVASGGVSAALVMLGILAWTWAMVLDREANATLDGTAVPTTETDADVQPTDRHQRVASRHDKPVIEAGSPEPATDGDGR